MRTVIEIQIKKSNARGIIRSGAVIRTSLESKRTSAERLMARIVRARAAVPVYDRTDHVASSLNHVRVH